MRNKLALMAALLTIILLWLHIFQVGRQWEDIGPRPAPLPLKKVSIEEYAKMVREYYNITIYLPSALPKGYVLTAAYVAVDPQNESRVFPRFGVVVYSAVGDEDPITAELVIGIDIFRVPPNYEELKETYKERGLPLLPPTVESLKWEYGDEADTIIMEVNGWPVMIDKHAAISYPARREKYGDYAPLAYVWIWDGKSPFYAEYRICAPELTVEELIEVIRSMRPFL